MPVLMLNKGLSKSILYLLTTYLLIRNKENNSEIRPLI